MAQDLLPANATLAAIMEAGRWSTPTMVGRYTRALSASRNVVAPFSRPADETARRTLMSFDEAIALDRSRESVGLLTHLSGWLRPAVLTRVRTTR